MHNSNSDSKTVEMMAAYIKKRPSKKKPPKKPKGKGGY